MTSLWLIIWRFQPFHKGHLLLVETSLRENPATLILIGSINRQDDSNPYSYEFRKEIIEAELHDKKVSIWWLPDFSDDASWWEYILTYIPEKVDRIILYCWDKENDSAVQSILDLQSSFPFQIEIREIPRSIIPISATQVRQKLREGRQEELKDFLNEKTLKKLQDSL